MYIKVERLLLNHILRSTENERFFFKQAGIVQSPDHTVIVNTRECRILTEVRAFMRGVHFHLIYEVAFCGKQLN